MIQLIKHFLIILFLLVCQLAILPNFPWYLSDLNLVLVMIIFIAVVYSFQLAVVYSFILGLLLDSFSTMSFGAYLIALILTVYIVYKLFERFLTNKSAYTLIGLTAIATVFFNIVIYLYKMLFYYQNAREVLSIDLIKSWIFQDFISQIIINLFFVAVLFVAFHFSSNRFKAVFIDTTKN
jgi:rod shape-determining protein MreD